MRSWADPSTSVATTLSITTSAATTATPLPLLHRGIFCLCFSPLDKSYTEGSEISQKPVRNRPNATLSLSLPCLFPHPPTRTPTPTIPIFTTTTASATATASAAGTTVSLPDRFRTAQAYFAPKFEIECVHAWILTLITRLATTLSTTTPAATAPPLPLVHLGISAFAFKFKSNWHESRWRSETSQKPVRNRPNATICFPPPSLSLSLSLFPSLSLSSLGLLLELLLLFLLLLLLLPLLLLLVLLALLLLVLLWVFRTVSGPRKLLLLPNLKSNAFTHGSLLSLLDLLLLLVLPPHPLLLHHHYH